MASRRRRRWPWVLCVALLALLALAWWFPARWAWSLLGQPYPAVQADGVGGSIWHGHADSLTVNGEPLGRLAWTLDRASVFGRVRGAFRLVGDEVMADGHIARQRAGAILIRDLDFRVPMARLKVLWPGDVALGGVLQGHVQHLRLRDGWPVVLAADVAWRDAEAIHRGRRVALGNFNSHWQAPGGSVVEATLSDEGNGPVALSGRFVMTALGWRLESDATPRRDDPGLRALLRRLGAVQADGSVHIGRHGGLAIMERRP